MYLFSLWESSLSFPDREVVVVGCWLLVICYRVILLFAVDRINRQTRCADHNGSAVFRPQQKSGLPQEWGLSPVSCGKHTIMNIRVQVARAMSL